MIRRIFFLLFPLLCLSFFLNACKAPPNYLAYQSQGFCAEVQGTMSGIEFEAQIEIKKSNAVPAEAITGDRLNAYELEIRYLAPKELDGICLSVKYDPSTKSMHSTAALGSLSVNIPREHIKGWLRPAESLLLPSQEKIESVQKTKSGYLLTFKGDISLTVDPSGRPLSLQSPEISFSVIRFQAET